ncbi:MAG: peptidase M4 family protein, partial [Methanobacteriota archaeon]
MITTQSPTHPSLEIRFAPGKEIATSDFWSAYKYTFGLSDEYQFQRFHSYRDHLGQVHHRYKQFYKGIELRDVQFVLHEQAGKVFYGNGYIVRGLDIEVTPLITEKQALENALNFIGAEEYMWESPQREAFLKKEQNDPDASFFPQGRLVLTSGSAPLTAPNFRLAYEFDVYSYQPFGRYYVFVDARTGEVFYTLNRIHTGDVPGTGQSMYNGMVDIIIDSFVGGYRLREAARGSGIQTFDMQNSTNYSTAVDFVDGDTNFTDPNAEAGVSAHWGAEATYDFYMNTFNRNSYDDAGGILLSYVHYGSSFNNAFWDGTRMTYGDGDGITFTPLVSLDVCGHELTHGVTQFSAGLIYQAESGALNESFSDIFGTMVEYYKEGSNFDWYIGEDITPNGNGIRSMSNPNEFGDPDTYFGDFWASLTGGDNGGVHTNSGVQNFWFYLLSEGGSGVNDNGDPYNVTGIGIDNA